MQNNQKLLILLYLKSKFEKKVRRFDFLWITPDCVGALALVEQGGQDALPPKAALLGGASRGPSKIFEEHSLVEQGGQDALPPRTCTFPHGHNRLKIPR